MLEPTLRVRLDGNIDPTIDGSRKTDTIITQREKKFQYRWLVYWRAEKVL